MEITGENGQKFMVLPVAGHPDGDPYVVNVACPEENNSPLAPKCEWQEECPRVAVAIMARYPSEAESFVHLAALRGEFRRFRCAAGYWLCKDYTNRNQIPPAVNVSFKLGEQLENTFRR